MKKNKVWNWFKGLSKKNKISYVLWIFVPIFIVILVGSLLGTTIGNYDKKFGPHTNIYSQKNVTFNEVFVPTEKNSDQDKLNYSYIAQLLASNAIDRGYSSGRSASDWIKSLENNDFFIYLGIGAPQSATQYVALINNNTNNTSDYVSTSIGMYDKNYSIQPYTYENALGKSMNPYQYQNSNNSSLEYAFVSLYNQQVTGSILNGELSLFITQIQNSSGQYPNLILNINNS